MSTDVALSISSLGLLAAAAVLLVSVRASHPHDPHALVGHLDRDSVSRDRARWGPRGPAPSRRSGREVEQTFALERRSTDVVPEQVAPAPVAWRPPDPEDLGVTRRQFLNRSIVASIVLSTTGFGAALLAYLWPSPSAGFGSKISIGSVTDEDAQIDAGTGFAYFPDGRMWVVPYPADALPKAKAVYSPAELVGMEAGFVALYQKCVHLGCRVPACLTSQWFECPCHGSQYNHVGEKKAGPAPRGLDRFPIAVSGSALTVDTGTLIVGPPIGTNTTGQEAEGPHCISGTPEG